jgi:tRNA A37 methylthiotransferase MiaB
VSLVRRICEERSQIFVGREFDVLITEKRRGFTGRTRGYRQVVVKGADCALGQVLRMRITRADRGSLFGEPVD